ncbi:MAG TPA: endo-1,4-beta-xylanase, partial [Pirellulaceae bacterium]|nr:endo-1,4-beta-xylanase [Pirellulaceae bacterium]
VLFTPHWPEVEAKFGQRDWESADGVVNWCREKNVRLCCGPLVLLDRHALPDWVFLDNDEEEVQTSVLSWLEAVVERYRGKVQIWHVAARLNQDGAFDFSEEQRLRLLVEAVDRVRALDARTPLVVSFDQPWGEYIARKDQELTPLHFADTLVRGELGLAGVGLEIHYGYWPGGTLPRDPLDVSRQLDRWSQLGVPLMVTLSAPSSLAADLRALHSAKPLPDLSAEKLSPKWQQDLIQWLLPMIASKPMVQAIVWDAWQDNAPHEFAQSGLLDAKGKSKPALQTMIDLRRDSIG